MAPRRKTLGRLERLLIGEMAVAFGDPPLQERRAGGGRLELRVVVRFDHQRVAAAEEILDRGPTVTDPGWPEVTADFEDLRWFPLPAELA